LAQKRYRAAMKMNIDTARFGLLQTVVDEGSYGRAVERFREARIVLPKFSELANPATISDHVKDALLGVDINDADPLNLFRVHWHNGFDSRTQVDVPEHVVLPPELTGVDAKIVMVFGNRFPMIGAHKVLAAYSCMVPRIVSGQFDPTRHRAVWPSTGNYARGGIAISRLMQSRGVAVLPENMSRERFEWLDRWVEDPRDVITTPGSESNVKEIYDACHELAKDDGNFILNQFAEFANHAGHFAVTGGALSTVYESLLAANAELNLAAITCASGSAGTLAMGDRLKEQYGTKIVAVEALECPTMLYNGYGEHNIQGIGDKHIPLIHNVMNTDMVAAISDGSTDALLAAFTTDVGKAHLVNQLGVDPAVVDQLRHFGLSSVCNMLAAIKTAKRLNLSNTDVVMSVATDGSELYVSEREAYLGRHYDGSLNEANVAGIIERHLMGTSTDHFEELNAAGRERVFNLGYYTWVEQQGVSVEDFDVRRDPTFWNALHQMPPIWDEMIDEFNAATGLN
jgi:cysteine synthase